jgi:hypothetical protein
MVDQSKTHWCCLCAAERGLQKPADADWPGSPICRECLAESIARTSGQPRIKPSHVAAITTTTLQ